MIDKKFAKANQYNRRGIKQANQKELDKAIKYFQKALKLTPNANSYYFLGLLYQTQGQIDKAKGNYREAIKLFPNFSVAHNNLGTIYLEEKDFQKAILEFKSAILSDPKNSSAFNNLGNAYRSSKKLTKAINNYQRALKIKPDTIETLNNLGLAFFEKNEIEKAKIYFKKAISVNPNHPQAYFHLGNVLANQKMFKQAIFYLESYLKIISNNAEAFALLGNFYLSLGIFEKAKNNFKKALKINPSSPYIINDLGNLYKQSGDFKKALNYYQKALLIDPSLTGVQNNIGVIFLNQGRFKKAIDVLEKALRRNPKLASAHYHLGLIYERKRQLDQAAKSLLSALKINPEATPALSILVYVLMQQCDWAQLTKQAMALDKTSSQEIKKSGYPNETPFLSVIRKENSKVNYQIAKGKSDQIKNTFANSSSPYFFKKRGNKKILRIGYLSNDFKDHATSHLIMGLFRLHDRKKFEIYAYSYGSNDKSSYRKKIENDCDKFRDCFNLDFFKTAQQIYQDEIDILVDLKGYTRKSRLEICALRPAPIQVTYLGFPGTTGADFIDYIITDKIVTPPEFAPYYSEKFVYLPDCYQINNNRKLIFTGDFKRSDFKLPQNAFVFSCFNRNYKIDQQTFKIWMKILKNVPNSILWLLKDNSFAEKNLNKEASLLKIDPKRIIFAEQSPQPIHIRRISLSDLCLDTFVCNGHTTTSDALRAGVPVITLQGKHFASRVASSILTAIGLTELITHSPQEYEKLAIKLAKNKKLLKQTREKLIKNKPIKPLFNTKKFVSNLEKAYTQMWNLYQAGKKPAQIKIN